MSEQLIAPIDIDGIIEDIVKARLENAETRYEGDVKHLMENFCTLRADAIDKVANAASDTLILQLSDLINFYFYTHYKD